MKKNLVLILIFTLLFPQISGLAESKDPDIFAEAAIIIDGKNSQVLFEKNSQAKLYPASTTKIMTAILALELGDLEDIVTIDKEVSDFSEGSHIALEVGEKLTLEQLLNALLIQSANDSALAIAKHISKDIDSFVSLMNKKARDLGAKNTNFTNPHGLHNDNHYTSAEDLALITKYAMQNKFFANIVKEYMYTIPKTNKKNEERHLKSANRLIYSSIKINVDGKQVESKYSGANGVKTGFTNKAGSCLVSSVNRNNTQLIAVVLNSDGENVFSDTHKLYNYAFNKYTNHKLGYKNQFIDNIKISKGEFDFTSALLKDDVSVNVDSKILTNIKTNIVLKDNLTAPIKKDQVIAKIQFFDNDNLLAESDLISSLDIKLDKNKIWYRKLFSKWYLFIFALMFISRLNKYKRRKKIQKLRKIRNLH